MNTREKLKVAGVRGVMRAGRRGESGRVVWPRAVGPTMMATGVPLSSRAQEPSARVRGYLRGTRPAAGDAIERAAHTAQCRGAQQLEEGS